MHISIQIIIATLSVLGLCFCLKTMASLIFTNEQIVAAVIIESETQLDTLDLLLEEASSALFATRGRRLAVCIPANIWESCSTQSRKRAKEISEEFGAGFYICTVMHNG